MFLKRRVIYSAQGSNPFRTPDHEPRKICWANLSMNPNAIHMLKAHPDKIYWAWLSQNPSALHLLEKYPEKINWDNLSFNPNAMHILEKYPDKIYWDWFLGNPSIFEIDIKQMNIELTKKAKNIDYYKT